MTEIKDALVEFSMDGARYSFTMPAESLADAEQRMRAIRTTGRIEGWPCYTCRANALTLPFVHAWVVFATWFRNATR